MMGTFRTCTSMAQTINSLEAGEAKNALYGVVQTTISAVAVAGTIFAHPVGMLVSTTHDLFIEVCQLIHHLQNNNPKEALNSCLSLFNNALYLSLFMYGGLELSILSLVGQILLGLYHARNEYQSGHWLEAAGHMGMALVRAKELLPQVNAFDKPSSAPSQDKAADSAVPQTNAPNPKILSEQIKEYENNSGGWPSLHYAILMNDEEAAQHFLQTRPEQATMLTPSLPIMKFQMGANPKNDRDNVWGTESGISAIELAIRHRCTTQFVKQLLTLGADFKAVRKEYYGSVRDIWESKTKYVYGKNKLVDFLGNDEHYQLFTPIYWAIINKNKALIDLLISKGCSLNDLAYKRREFIREYRGRELFCDTIQEQYTVQQLLEKIGS